MVSAVGSESHDGLVFGKTLLADTIVKSLDISVVTRKGEVQLSGFVDNQIQIDRAIHVARGIENVSSVSNEMSLKK